MLQSNRFVPSAPSFGKTNIYHIWNDCNSFMSNFHHMCKLNQMQNVEICKLPIFKFSHFRSVESIQFPHYTSILWLSWRCSIRGILRLLLSQDTQIFRQGDTLSVRRKMTPSKFISACNSAAVSSFVLSAICRPLQQKGPAFRLTLSPI